MREWWDLILRPGRHSPADRDIINELQTSLLEKRIQVNYTEELKNYIIDSSFSDTFGARPIKRFIQKNIETAIANAIIKEEVLPGDTINVDVNDNNIIITK